VEGTFDRRLVGGYAGLSERLRRAGDYVAQNPVSVATRSLRAIASDAGLAPATFSRLARALDYPDFEQLRESIRRKIGQQLSPFADRAGRLQQEHGDAAAGFAAAHLRACLGNIERLGQVMDPAVLSNVADRLHDARRVVVLGGLASAGPVEYVSYLASYFAENWSLAGRGGASVAGALTGLGARDVLVVLTKAPYSTVSIRSAELAASRGVYVVVIADGHACPALRHASAGFTVPTDSPHFFSSYVATLALLETIVGMLVSRSGQEARERIAEVEEMGRSLNEVRPA